MPIVAGQSDELTMLCTKHKKKVLEYYCNVHAAFLCTVCVTLQHTENSGCHVDYIPEISGQFVDSSEYTNALKEVEGLTEKCQLIIADIRDRTTKSNSSLKEGLAKIKKYRQELEELEREAIDKVKNCNQVNDSRLQTAETTCDEVIKALQSSSDFLKQLNTSNEADKLFVELKHNEQRILDHVMKLSHLASSEDIKEYDFSMSTALIECLEKEKSLGTLREETLTSQIPPETIALKHQRDTCICIKTKQDKKTCRITGMAISAPGQVFLVDRNNNAVKMVNINTRAIIDQLKLKSSPKDITEIGRNEFAVTIPSDNKIQLVSFSSRKLKQTKPLKVDGECYGISCYQGKLAVTFRYPVKLQIIDLEGNILSTVTTNLNGKGIFGCPVYVTTNRNSVYVSDSRERGVMRLNWKGEVTGSYEDMDLPLGLTMLENGSFFVCALFRGTYNIQNISGDCKTSTTVARDLNCPWAICWCQTNRTLYVSTNSGFENQDNFLHQYQAKV